MYLSSLDPFFFSLDLTSSLNCSFFVHLYTLFLSDFCTAFFCSSDFLLPMTDLTSPLLIAFDLDSLDSQFMSLSLVEEGL